MLRKLIVFALQLPFLRSLVAATARKRYRIAISPSVRIPFGTTIPNDIELQEDVVVHRDGALAPFSKVLAEAQVRSRLPVGSIVQGDPAQVTAFIPLTNGGGDAEPPILADVALNALLDHFEFDTVVDVGSGAGWHAAAMVRRGKRVTCVDFGTSYYYQAGGDGKPDTVIGDYSKIEFDSPFDCAWASHVLEHQPDPHQFLLKLNRDVKEGGILALTVPPMKQEIVGGHLNLYNTGMLLYRLVFAGFDCSQAHVLKYGYNISVIIRKRSITLPPLDYDIGDIERLAPYFPFKAVQGFNGDIENLNWRWPRKSVARVGATP